MNDANSRPTPDILDHATEALRDAPVPAGPPADLTAAILAAVHNRLAGAVPSELARHQRRRRIMRYVGFGTATAAAVVLATTAALFWGGGTAEAKFKKAMENAEKATSMRAKITTTAGDMTFEMKMYGQGDRFRNEMDMGKGLGGFVIIVDGKQQKGLQLMTPAKTAQWLDLTKPDEKTRGISKDATGMAGLFGELKGKDVKTLPDETVDGRKLKVYSVKGHRLSEAKGEADVTIWIDPKTELPAKCRVDMTINGVKAASEMVILGWNEELDGNLFELKVPEGYVLIDPSPQGDKPVPFAVLLGPVLEKVKQAESVTFVETQTLGTQQPMEMKYAIRGPMVRIDAGGKTVLIIDTKQKLGVMLIPPAKAYVKLDKEKLHGPAAGSPIDDLLALKDRKPESTGEEKLDGKVVQKLTIKGDPTATPPGDWVIWVDPKTELPVKMTYEGKTLAGGKEVPVSKVYEKFVWNAKIDDKLFRMDVPEGYTEGFPGQTKKNDANPKSK